MCLAMSLGNVGPDGDATRVRVLDDGDARIVEVVRGASRGICVDAGAVFCYDPVTAELAMIAGRRIRDDGTLVTDDRIVELRGLEVPGRHGVLAEERERDRVFLFDISFDVSDSALSDRIEDAVDYRLVVDAVREVNEQRFELLEALASTVAETVMSRFALARVKVRVRKRPAGLPVEYSAVTAERP